VQVATDERQDHDHCWGSLVLPEGGVTMTLITSHGFSFLLPYRVLMVWVYDRTRSLLVVILMHAPVAAS
jgi:hypothetical protein